MSTLCPGIDGTPVPDGVLIFRIGKNAQLSPAGIGRRKASPAMFELSTDDKNSPGKRLSVWLEELTVADQAWAFMGANPERTVVACLNVDSIHAMPVQPGFSSLRVEWEQGLTEDASGNKLPNTLPGGEGHAGIANLHQGADNKTDSKKRKALRSILADIAKISPVLVPHDIPEEHIQIAAFFISLKPDQSTGSQAQDWIKAIRQLRRDRVKQDAQQTQAR
jgi:hypothetical protein